MSLPQGRCWHVILPSGLHSQGQSCACPRFILNARKPGAQCECNHHANYHNWNQEEERSEAELLKQRIEDLEDSHRLLSEQITVATAAKEVVAKSKTASSSTQSNPPAPEKQGSAKAKRKRIEETPVVEEQRRMLKKMDRMVEDMAATSMAPLKSDDGLIPGISTQDESIAEERKRQEMETEKIRKENAAKHKAWVEAQAANPPPKKPPCIYHPGCRHGASCSFSHDLTIKERKPPVCKFYQRPGGCRKGDNCAFTHDRPVTQTKPPKIKVPEEAICKLYARGSCRRGKHCVLWHDPAIAAQGPVEDKGSAGDNGSGRGVDK